MSVRARPSEAARANIDGIHGARVRVTSAREGSSLVVRRSYRIPRMRVAPGEYPQLARFCRASDESESAEIIIRM